MRMTKKRWRNKTRKQKPRPKGSSKELACSCNRRQKTTTRAALPHHQIECLMCCVCLLGVCIWRATGIYTYLYIHICSYIYRWLRVHVYDWLSKSSLSREVCPTLTQSEEFCVQGFPVDRWRNLGFHHQDLGFRCQNAMFSISKSELSTSKSRCSSSKCQVFENKLWPSKS